MEEKASVFCLVLGELFVAGRPAALVCELYFSFGVRFVVYECVERKHHVVFRFVPQSTDNFFLILQQSSASPFFFFFYPTGVRVRAIAHRGAPAGTARALPERVDS